MEKERKPWLAMTEGRSAEGHPLWPQGSTASDAVYPLLHEIAPQPPEGVVYPLLSELNPQPSSDVVYPLLSELNPQPSSDVVYPLLHELRPQPPEGVVYLQMPNESRRWPSPVAFPIVQANGMVGIPGWFGDAGQQGLTELERQRQQQMRPDVAGGFPEYTTIPGYPVQKQSVIDFAQYSPNSSLLENTLTDKSDKCLCGFSSDYVNVSSSLYSVLSPETPSPFSEIPLVAELTEPQIHRLTDLENQNFPRIQPIINSVTESIEGHGNPRPVPSSAFQSIRSWLTTLFANAPRVKQAIAWKSINKYRDWDPIRYDVSDVVAVQHEAWQEFFSYFWTIEQLYEYYGLIRNSLSSFATHRPHPPTLDLPFWLTNEQRTVNEDHARRYYLAYLAHSFVLEKHRLVSWSLIDYAYSTTNNLMFLLHSDNFCKIELNQYNSPYFSMRVGPSDPTVLFLWMVERGWINPNHPKSRKLDNTKRAELRDQILRWCGGMIDHTTQSPVYAERTPGYPLLKKSDGELYQSVDYFFDAYWGSPRIPPVIRMISGYCMPYQSIFYTEQGVRYLFETPPEPMRDSISVPFKTFLVRCRRGCWDASELLIYLLRTVNIPAYSFDKILLGHDSFILPAEPDPHHPEIWVIPHSDDLFHNKIVFVNPLFPAPMNHFFWTWGEWVKAMKEPNLHPKDPQQSTTPSNNTIYHTKLTQLSQSRRDKLARDYPTLQTIVGAIALQGLLEPFKTTGNTRHPFEHYYKGPYTQWKYRRSYLENMTNDSKELARDYIKMSQILSLVPSIQISGLGSQKTAAGYYWSIFDNMMYQKFIPQSYQLPILKKFFHLNCG